VREKIIPEFTLIRWETFPYPFFCESNGDILHSYLSVFGNNKVTISVPFEYEVVATETLTNKINADGITQFIYLNSNSYINNFNCSIAKYKKIHTSVGVFYLLNDSLQSDVVNIMKEAHKYMNEHFGIRDVNSDTKYAAIPDGLGSFTSSKAGVVYIQESTFNSISNLNQIIHEFIHLGWNPKADESVKKNKFFDEAFTSYFEMRVMDYLMGESYMLNKLIDSYKWQMSSGEYQFVPINDFGKYKYGDLSYTSVQFLCMNFVIL